jgi:chorismate mutase
VLAVELARVPAGGQPFQIRWTVAPERNPIIFVVKERRVTMPVRGVRGATVVGTNGSEAIRAATVELLQMILDANPSMHPSDLGSVLFTVPEELDAAFPAQAARTLPGWRHVPLLCAREIPVPGTLPRVVRVLAHWNTEIAQEAVRHVYLREAAGLRPDIDVADGDPGGLKSPREYPT